MKRIFILQLICAFSLMAKSQQIDSTTKFSTWNSSRSECEFKGFALNTIFNLPIVRYNINSLDASKHDVLGTLEYFNSVGAGASLSFGKIHIKERNGKMLSDSVLDEDRIITMKNVIGISAGVLFSKNDSVGSNRIIFAPNLNLQILDFQIGMGYELGTVSNKAHRCFFTIAYGIPLAKFSDVGSYLFKSRVTRPAFGVNKQNVKTLRFEGIF